MDKKKLSSYYKLEYSFFKKLLFNSFNILFLLFYLNANSQEKITIKGKITDNTNVPLPGVSVIINGTTTGTESDFEGDYKITTNIGETLTFSYVGMKTIQIIVKNNNDINLTMQEDASLLNEVVVVAYGKQAKKAIVGSVASIDSKILEKQQVTTITSSLQGTTAGVNIMSVGGQPGSNPVVRIRGFASINGSNSPLYVVDGAVYNGNINVFSPDQIASISVLKDGASTALYGSRATAGVIVITTKKGRRNSAPKVTIKTQIGIASQSVKPHEILNIDDQFKYTWEAIKNDKQYIEGDNAILAGTKATKGLIDFIGYNPYGPNTPTPVNTNGNLVSTKKIWETDWRDVIFNNAAIRSEHSFSISGGNENTTYFLSGNYLNQDGSVKTSNFERITTRLNVDTQANKWLSAGLGVTYSTSKQNVPIQTGGSTTSATAWALSLSPIYPVYQRDENGQLIKDAGGNLIYDLGASPLQPVNGTRPYAPNQHAFGQLYFNDQSHIRDNINLNANVKIHLTPDLSFKTMVNHTYFVYDYYNYASNQFGSSVSNGGAISQTKDTYLTTTINNSLSYRKKLGDHSINALVLQEAYKYKYGALSATGEGLLGNSNTLGATTTPTSVSGGDILHRISSYLGRLSYNYKEKYFVEGSYRTDESSRFAPDARRGNFYSVGGSWIVSEEAFLKGNKVLNNLKLKASYGQLGNESNDNGYFLYLTNFLTGYNEGSNPGVLYDWPSDPKITWEEAVATNFGVDFKLFNFLNTSFEYFNKQTNKLFYDLPSAPSTGFSEVTTNNGSLRNYGWELSLNTQNISTKNFEWSSNFNISTLKSEILALENEDNSSNLKEGGSRFEFYMRKYAGVNSDTGEAQWYKDVLDTDNKPTGVKEITTDYSAATRYYTGKEFIPKFTGGFNNYFRLGNFDLNILLNYSFGSYLYDYDYASLMNGFKSQGYAASVDLKDRWQKPGDITNVPRLQTNTNSFNSYSDRFLFKNDYVRLKALTFGYSLPQDAIKSIGASALRIYFQGDNLFTYQSHKGVDPEQGFGGGTNQRALGQKTYTFGLKLQF